MTIPRFEVIVVARDHKEQEEILQNVGALGYEAHPTDPK